MKIAIHAENGDLLEAGRLDAPFAIRPAVLRRAGRAFTVRMAVPIRDIAGYFGPATSDGPVPRLDWTISFNGHASRNFPALCFFSQAGENRFTLFFDDLVDDFRCTARMNQAACAYDIEWTFSVGSAAKAVTAHLDRGGGPWPRAFARVLRRLRPQGLPAFPAAAWLPVYCTWYAAHACLTNDFLDANARAAAELGCGTFIVDDGWCYDEMKRVTPETIGPWYDDIGDWEVSARKLPDFRAHVRYAQSLGLKYLLWVAPYFCFKNSRFHASLPKERRDIAASYGTFVYDIADRAASASVLRRMARLVSSLGLDGLKVDFLDVQAGDPAKPLGRASLDFVRRLSAAVRRAAGPDALIEFRQSYATPQMLDFATQFRAGDVPFDYLRNVSKLAAMRVLLGDGVPIHADPLYWAPDEGVTTVARHFVASLAGVPMVSMDLARLPAAHRAVAAHYLGFYREHLAIFAKGRWDVRFSGQIPAWLSATRGRERVVILVDAFRLGEAVAGFNGACHLLNLTDRAIPADEAFGPDGAALPPGSAVPCGGRGTIR